MDARNRRVFAAIYQDGAKILEDCVLDLEDLKERLPGSQSVYFLGDGALAYQDELKPVSYTHLDVYKRQREKP